MVVNTIVIDSFTSPFNCTTVGRSLDLKTYSLITKTSLFKYIENFTTKNWKFSDKKKLSFHISAENIDCGYSLEPPRRGGSKSTYNLGFWAELREIMYTPVNPSFTI